MRRRYRKLALAVAASIALASACAGDDVSTPTVVLSEDEIQQWEDEVSAFGDRVHTAWPDIDGVFADYADDAAFYDPTSGDYLVEGKDTIVSIHRMMASVWPDMSYETMATYLSADAAALHVEITNLWPPWVPKPPDPPPVEFLEVYRFENDRVVSFEVWNTVETFELTGLGCFVDGGCVAELEAIADRYLTAWSSGDAEQIAALYAEDAVFSDSLLGLDAAGASAIDGLADERFEPGGDLTFEVLGLAAQIDGPSPPNEASPDQGRIIAVGIHYRWTTNIEGEPTSADSLTTFELGTRQGDAFEREPTGLITREEVFHEPNSLLEAGLMS